MKFAGNRCISSLKAVKIVSAAATSNMVRGAFTSRFGVVGSRHFETHGPRPHKVLGSDLVNIRESRRVKAKRTGQAE
jgi:hypothetical protein